MRELELKFTLPLALQDSLARDCAATDRVQRVWSCYYDTPDGALARARMALRVRLHGERWVQTVKTDDGDRFERFEWERPIAGAAPVREALPPDATPQGVLLHRSFGQLRALFETDFERTARRLAPAPGLLIELAQDLGELRCADRREPIREVELECLEGTRAAFFGWALDWARREQACLLWPSKHERGLRLAARMPQAPPPVKSVATTPAPTAAPGEAAGAVLRGCIAHACANIEPMLAGEAVEGPHQFRVALRRLRAALRFFELRTPDGLGERLDADASALADAAGRVRDLDVFESGLLRELRGRFPGDAAIETLTHAVAEARDVARRELRRTLTATQTTQFVLRTLLLAEQVAGSGAGGRFDDFAARRLQALHRRVRRRVRAALDADGWHRSRIAVKNLRYGLECAGAALPRGVDGPRAMALLARWQDRLGAGQDLAVARDVAADAMARPGVPTDAAVRATALIDAWRAFEATPPSDQRPHARRALHALRETLRGLPTTSDAPTLPAAGPGAPEAPEAPETGGAGPSGPAADDRPVGPDAG